MPGRKYTTRKKSASRAMTTYRKKPVKKRRQQPAWNQILRIKTVGALPPRARLKMQYAHTVVFGDGAVTMENQVYRLNSVWDPDFTGTGVTATGYSTFAALYGRYFVHGSEVQVTMSVRDTTAVATDSVNQICGCVVTDFIPGTPTAAGFDSEELIEKYRIQNTVRGTASGGLYRLNYRKVSANASGVGFASAGLATMWGKKNENAGAYHFTDKRRYKLDDPLAIAISGGMIEHEADGEFPLTSAISGNPLDVVYLNVFAFSIGQDNGNALPLRYTYVTTLITYDVEWYAPNSGVPTYSTAESGTGTTIDVAETKLA